MNIDHWIGGKHVGSAGLGASGKRFPIVNPDDDSVIGSGCHGEAADVAAAVEAAHQAFTTYSTLGPSAREAVLFKAAELLQQQSDAFCDLLIREIGSPISKARMEIAIATRVLKATAGMPRRMTGRTYSSDLPGSSDIPSRWSFAVRRPLGVVAAITPFNVPLIKAAKHLGMPLAFGNTVTWLPSMHTSMLADRVASLFAQAGLPDGALNVVHGPGSEIGDDLVAHPQVRAVGFTGSAVVGRHVQSVCGQAGKRVTLELGGKNPLVVLDDANLDDAVAAAIRGGFIYQGQICMASSRVIVQRGIYEAFAERFVAAAGGVAMGPLDDPETLIGPIINASARGRIQSHLTEAISKGARVRCGNTWQGNRLNPTVLEGVDASMTLFHQETFGPVVTLEPADDVGHAIELAHAGPGMLSAAIFTTKLDAAYRFADSLQAGMVHINDMTIQQEPEVPFGSDGTAGFGREGMETGVDDYTTWKWVTVKV